MVENEVESRVRKYPSDKYLDPTHTFFCVEGGCDEAICMTRNFDGKMICCKKLAIRW